MPHSGHKKLLGVVVTAGIDKWRMVKRKKRAMCVSHSLLGFTIYLQPLTLDLRVQASMPSNQLCSASLLPAPPQFLYQVPPGAQQLTRADFLKVAQCGHIKMAERTAGMVCGVLAIRHRASHL